MILRDNPKTPLASELCRPARLAAGVRASTRLGMPERVSANVTHHCDRPADGLIVKVSAANDGETLERFAKEVVTRPDARSVQGG
jgi:hypothetical protein